MPTLQEQIASKFLAELSKDKDFDAAKLQSLRGLLAEGKKPKADELVAIFSVPAGEDVA
jgi:hypothetical protein